MSDCYYRLLKELLSLRHHSTQLLTTLDSPEPPRDERALAVDHASCLCGYLLRALGSESPRIPMILFCPAAGCGARHLDEGPWEDKPHHTHSCQHCGFTWRPAVVNTVGVRFLPGFKNDEEE